MIVYDITPSFPWISIVIGRRGEAKLSLACDRHPESLNACSHTTPMFSRTCPDLGDRNARLGCDPILSFIGMKNDRIHTQLRKWGSCECPPHHLYNMSMCHCPDFDRKYKVACLRIQYPHPQYESHIRSGGSRE